LPAKKPVTESQIAPQRKKLVDKLYHQLPQTTKPTLSESLSPLVDFYSQRVKSKGISLFQGYSLLAEDLMSLCNRASGDGRRDLASHLFVENRKALTRALQSSLGEKYSFSAWLRLLHLRWHGLVSGYGTRPGRLILWIVLVIYWWSFFFILANYLSITNNAHLVFETSNAFSIFSYLYFSVQNFLPMGGSPITALTFGGQLLLTSESIVGYILSGYLVELIVRRSRF
jgi:hypothetical protein